MYLQTALIAATFATLSTLATAAPVPSASPSGGLTAAIITTILPATAACTGTDQYANQCRTAEQAAPLINNSFKKYGISSKAEQVALLSIMLFESVGFKYNHNISPGRPGQGTRNMQMIGFNLQYAQSLFPPDKVAAANASGPNDVLALVNTDDYSFASAAWFLTSQPACSAIRTELQTGSTAGWTAYLTQCVGTTDTPDRDVIWNAAKAAMGV
ncbi:uncharacterized protein BDZ99DRAFT_464462 [Mytilinidion resinicola]|uniref:Transglycosylase SLT domain-containing protein n=1 Tax=Mytilinidion resinicola TaxID=574789 RepID=A0A6A6YKW6_9PEZI|nr:uncharacterized protein BDZ99DRAFT_464462 [Mytilinidion resinicola]KAF2808615.1 hypothetical protein BDZ99DRAFT_464462 [Mytilinidion resinicola]